ncbi:hypothetical protein DFP96_10461 [Listeria rocourtiae]|uniref:Uncharacterized protein n=1 Tax=Listeria rocourtiae TaxID=647910 RepID=A0A4R6ZM95_9LIST|nr:hypothetical protein DFP96_10461 [Listeria rocourtiae]
MSATRLSMIFAPFIGMSLYFILTSNDFFLYFGVPAIIIVNIIRVIGTV